MVVFFTEQDLVSFGNYVLSNVRKENILAHSTEESEEVVAQRLQNVSDADLANWAYLVQQAQVQSEQQNNSQQ